jgi:hypothetical protein
MASASETLVKRGDTVLEGSASGGLDTSGIPQSFLQTESTQKPYEKDAQPRLHGGQTGR